MILKKALESDLQELSLLEQEVFQGDPFALSRASIRYHLKKSTIYTLSIDGVIVAYALWLERKKYYRLYSLAVNPLYRSRGYAKTLLQFSMESLHDKEYFSLEVKVDNFHAIELYKSLGFKITKRLKEYYPQGVDGYLLIK